EEMRHFVADASHELRTPLTSIAGYIDVLSRRQNVDSETLHESLRAMQQETSRMTRLVNDLLTLTRFESGTAPHPQRLQLDAFLNQALHELSRRDRGAALGHARGLARGRHGCAVRCLGAAGGRSSRLGRTVAEVSPGAPSGSALVPSA